MSDLGRDMSMFLDDPPSICIYGMPGSGKTTDVFRAFPNGLFLVTSKSVLRPAVSSLRDEPVDGVYPPLPLFDHESGQVNSITFDPAANGGKGVTKFDGWDTIDGVTKPLKMDLEGIRRGAFIALPEFSGKLGPKGEPERLNNWETLTSYTNAFIQRVKLDPTRYDALIYDEMSQFSARILEDIKADKRFRAASGKQDMFKAQNELHVFHRWLGKFVPQASKKAIVLVCHGVEPKYFDDETDPRYGKLKYQGGPKFPIGSLIESVTADMDVVLQLQLVPDEVGMQRVYETQAHPLYVRKFRDFSVKGRVNIGLRNLLKGAGYRLNLA